jgi:hypothetical protein
MLHRKAKYMLPTPNTDEIRDAHRGDTVGLCRALIPHANSQERRIAELEHIRDIWKDCVKDVEEKLRDEKARAEKAEAELSSLRVSRNIYIDQLAAEKASADELERRARSILVALGMGITIDDTKHCPPEKMVAWVIDRDLADEADDQVNYDKFKARIAELETQVRIWKEATCKSVELELDAERTSHLETRKALIGVLSAIGSDKTKVGENFTKWAHMNVDITREAGMVIEHNIQTCSSCFFSGDCCRQLSVSNPRVGCTEYTP